MAACWSINMRIFRTTELLLLLSLVGSCCLAAPANLDPDNLPKPEGHEESSPAEIEESSPRGNYVDQRQNGTENYRIEVDGLAIVVAPIEALLLAGNIPGTADFNIFGSADGTSKPEDPVEPRPKPDKEEESVEAKPGKSTHRSSLRLMSLLQPLLRKIHPHH